MRAIKSMERNASNASNSTHQAPPDAISPGGLEQTRWRVLRTVQTPNSVDSEWNMSVDVCRLCLITAPLWTIKLWTGTTWSLTPQLQTVSHNIMIVSSNLSQSKANSLWCHSFWWLLRSPMIGSYIGRVPNGSQIREHCAQSIQLHSTMIKLYPLHFTRTEWPLPLRPAWPTWKQNCYTLTDSNTRQFTHDTFMIPHDTHRPRLPKTAQCFSQVPQWCGACAPWSPQVQPSLTGLGNKPQRLVESSAIHSIHICKFNKAILEVSLHCLLKPTLQQWTEHWQSIQIGIKDKPRTS